jgi:hypothetical protein
MDGAQAAHVRLKEHALAVIGDGRNALDANLKAKSAKRFDGPLVDGNSPTGRTTGSRVSADIRRMDAQASDGHLRSKS